MNILHLQAIPLTDGLFGLWIGKQSGLHNCWGLNLGLINWMIHFGVAIPDWNRVEQQRQFLKLFGDLPSPQKKGKK